MNSQQLIVNYFEERIASCVKEAGISKMQKKALQELAKALQIQVNNERVIYQITKSLFYYLIQQKNLDYFITNVWRKYPTIKKLIPKLAEQIYRDGYTYVHYKEIQKQIGGGQHEPWLEFSLGQQCQIPYHYNTIGTIRDEIRTIRCVCQNIQKIRQNLKNKNSFLKCINCINMAHKQCMEIQDEDTYECPACILNKMDPLTEVKATLVEPSVLNSGLTTNFNFFLTKDAYEALCNQPKMGIEIRCIRIDGKNNYETTWPDKGEIFLNDSRVAEIKPLQINSSLKKRKDEKVFLREIRIFKPGENKLEFKEQMGTAKEKQTYRLGDHTHVIGIYLVKKLNVQNLVDKVKLNNVNSKQNSIEQIKKQMNEQNQSDEDVCIDKLVISLKDAITQEPIEYPIKGKFCQHVQCFDLKNYITIVDKLNPRKWNCPICKNRCFDLQIDGYLLEIIKANTNKEKQTEVYFDKEANYYFENDQKDKKDQNIYMEAKKKNQKSTRYVKVEYNEDIETIFNKEQNCYVLDEESEVDQNEVAAQQEKNIREQPVEIVIDSESDEQGAEQQKQQQVQSSQPQNQMNNANYRESQQVNDKLNQSCQDLQKDINQIDQDKKNRQQNNVQGPEQNQRIQNNQQKGFQTVDNRNGQRNIDLHLQNLAKYGGQSSNQIVYTAVYGLQNTSSNFEQQNQNRATQRQQTPVQPSSNNFEIILSDDDEDQAPPPQKPQEEQKMLEEQKQQIEQQVTQQQQQKQTTVQEVHKPNLQEEQQQAQNLEEQKTPSPKENQNLHQSNQNISLQDKECENIRSSLECDQNNNLQQDFDNFVKNRAANEPKNDKNLTHFDNYTSQKITNAFKRQFPFIMRQVSKELSSIEPQVGKKTKSSDSSDVIMVSDENRRPQQLQHKPDYLQQFFAAVKDQNNSMNSDNKDNTLFQSKLLFQQNQLLNFLSVGNTNINVNNFNINQNKMDMQSLQQDKGKTSDDAMIID